MAKEEKGRVKIRLIEVEVDGSNKTLQDALQALTGALTRANAPARALRATSPQADEGATQDESEVIDGDRVEATEESPKKPRKTSVPSYKVKDIDLKQGSVTWEAFHQAKSPPSDIMKHLVAAYWLTHFAGQDSVDTDDIFTLYRAAKWSTPKNLYYPLRDLANKRAFMRASGGKFEINHLGEDEVKRMGAPIGDH